MCSYCTSIKWCLLDLPHFLLWSIPENPSHTPPMIYPPSLPLRVDTYGKGYWHLQAWVCWSSLHALVNPQVQAIQNSLWVPSDSVGCHKQNAHWCSNHLVERIIIVHNVNLLHIHCKNLFLPKTYLISSMIGSANSKQLATLDVATNWQLYSWFDQCGCSPDKVK